MPFTSPRSGVNFLTLPDGWDAAWRAAKEASGSTPAWLAVVGDSVSQGFSATDPIPDGWWGKLRTGLVARYPTIYGDFYSTGESPYVSTSWAGVTTTPPWVIYADGVETGTTQQTGSGDPQLGNAALDRNITWTGVAAGSLAQFTSPYAATALDVILSKYFAAAGTITFTVSLAGGDITPTVSTFTGFSIQSHSYNAGGDLLTVVVNVPANNVANPLLKVSLAGLTSAAHVVTFTAQSADNMLGLVGINLIKTAASGIGYAKIASVGQSASQFSIVSHKPTNRAMVLQGLTGLSTASPSTVGFGFPCQPALAILALGLNDCTGLSSPALLHRVLTNMARSLRRGYDNCSLLVLANSNPDGVSSDTVSGLLTNPRSWHEYVGAMRDVAEQWNAAFYNVHAQFGQRAQAAGYHNANAHPTSAGHTLIANTLLGVL